MALQLSHHSVTDSLRLVTQRLAATPAQRLPHVIPSLATTLSGSKDGFLAAQSQHESHNASEASVLVHRLRTQISALLQDRGAEERYAAVVLIKAIIEVGGWNVLQGAKGWIQGLISMLGRPNSRAMKKLCVLALTRIFILTHDYPSLVREITTPFLPGFIITSLNLMKDKGSESRNDVQDFLMQSFNELIPRHPASFRPFCARLRALIMPLVAPVPSDILSLNKLLSSSVPLAENARRLFVSISICAPKNTVSEQWTRCLQETIECTHSTANLAFRALLEDTSPSTEYQGLDDALRFQDVVQQEDIKPLELTPWTGIGAGIERLDGLLKTLGVFLTSPSSLTVVVPVGELVGVIERFLSALPPSKDTPVRTRPEISKEEREGLFIGLPHLHVSALRLSSLLLSRMSRDAAIVSNLLLNQILWTLEHVASIQAVRIAAYEVISQILKMFGASLPRSLAPGISTCIKLCCGDLVALQISTRPEIEPSTTSKRNSPRHSISANPEHFLKAPKSSSRTSHGSHEAKPAAVKLLSAALTMLPKGFMTSSLRQQIDRTAILSNNKDVIFASAMNPPTIPSKPSSASSLLPFLARAFPSDLEVEALVRPRMPPIQIQYDHGFYPCEDQDPSPNNFPNNIDLTHYPQPSPQNDLPALAELKRQRTAVDQDFPEDRDANPDLIQALNPSNWPQEAKRQKVSQEASPTLATTTLSDTQPTAATAPVTLLSPDPRNSDNPNGGNGFTVATAAMATDKTPQSSLALESVEVNSGTVEAHIRPVMGGAVDDRDNNINDEDESDDDEIPLLEMDSENGDGDDGDEGKDHNEDDSKHIEYDENEEEEEEEGEDLGA